MRLSAPFATGALGALGLLTACPAHQDPKVAPEHETGAPLAASSTGPVGGGPSATASSGPSAIAPGSVEEHGACTRDEDCATGLECACLAPGPQCAPRASCAPCGAELCVDPSRPPPAMPSPPPR